jgi:hypothetical protein
MVDPKMLICFQKMNTASANVIKLSDQTRIYRLIMIHLMLNYYPIYFAQYGGAYLV